MKPAQPASKVQQKNATHAMRHWDTYLQELNALNLIVFLASTSIGICLPARIAIIRALHATMVLFTIAPHARWELSMIEIYTSARSARNSWVSTQARNTFAKKYAEMGTGQGCCLAMMGTL